MALKLVDQMTENPAQCMFCGTTPSHDGKALPAIEAEGIDYDWGLTPYVCSECVGIMAQLMGYITPEVRGDLERELRELSSRHSKLLTKYRNMKARVRNVTRGERSRRELQRVGSD